jgi:hypothetical protein
MPSWLTGIINYLAQSPQRLILSAAIGSSVSINILLWLLIIFFFPRDTPTAILHYNLDIGIDFMGEGRQIKALPLAGLALLLGNFTLASMIHKNYSITAWILWLITPLVQLLFLLAFIRIWLVNY